MELPYKLIVICLVLSTNIDITEQAHCGSQRIKLVHEPDDKLVNNLFNPARGFYIDSITSSRYFHPLEKDYLSCLRDNHGTNLMLRLYNLETFANGSPISADFLQKLEEDFKAAKEAGFSLILRFMYSSKFNSQYDPTSEPTVAQIQQHIKQLAPVIAKYDGVVVAVQAGFHGEYGLWYTPGTNSIQTDTSVLTTLVQQLPPSISVQVVNPDFKTKVGQTQQIGHYHECLLEGDVNEIKSAFPDLSKDAQSLNYLMTDSRGSLTGGKTCHPGDTSHPPRNLCTESEKLFKDIHLTYLNVADPDEAIKNYQQNGCYQNLANQLGYRFTLESVSLPHDVNANSTVCVGFSLLNRGMAAPVRHYNVSLILGENLHSAIYEAKIDADVTKWLPGTRIELKTSFKLPPSILKNTTYKVYLKISDPKLANYPDYNIILANADSNTTHAHGLSKLGDIKISPDSSVSSPAYVASSILTQSTLPHKSSNPRVWSKVSRSCLTLPNGPPTTANVQTMTPGGSGSITFTTTSMQQPSTTSRPFVPFMNDTSKLEKCKKLDTVKALLQFSYFSNPATVDCPNLSSKATPEAILVSFCNAPTDTLLWKPKGRVIDNCEKIPMYSRVAVFSDQNYYDYDMQIRKCGVFLGCLKTGSKVTGVKIGMQLCGRPFDIENAHFSNEKDLDHLYVF